MEKIVCFVTLFEVIANNLIKVHFNFKFFFLYLSWENYWAIIFLFRSLNVSLCALILALYKKFQITFQFLSKTKLPLMMQSFPYILTTHRDNVKFTASLIAKWWTWPWLLCTIFFTCLPSVDIFSYSPWWFLNIKSPYVYFAL